MSNNITLQSNSTVNPIFNPQMPAPIFTQLFKRGIQCAAPEDNSSGLQDVEFEQFFSVREKLEELEKLETELKALFVKLKNSDISNDDLYKDLLKTAPEELMKSILTNISIFQKKTKEALEEALENNPRILLHIRDQQNKNILEHYLQSLSTKIENVRHLNDLHFIQSLNLMGSDTQKFKEIVKNDLHSRQTIAKLLKSLHPDILSPRMIDRILQNPTLLVETYCKLERRIQKSLRKTPPPFHYVGLYLMADRSAVPINLNDLQNLYLEQKQAKGFCSENQQKESCSQKFQSAIASILEEGITGALDSRPQEIKKLCFGMATEDQREANKINEVLIPIQKLVESFYNPSISDNELYEMISNIPSKELIFEIKRNLALYYQNPDEVLRSNPRLLLQIKDREGRTLFDQFLSHERNRSKDLSLRSTLYSMQALALEIQSDRCEKTRKLEEENLRLILLKNPETSEEINHLLQTHFKAASTQDTWICELSKNSELFMEIFLYLTHKSSVAQAKTQSLFYYASVYQLSDGFHLTDLANTTIATDIHKMHQMQHFYFELLQPSSAKQRKNLLQKFSELDPEIKTVLGRAIWIAYSKTCHGDTLIHQDPYIFLNCQNQENENIICQLINHYKKRIKLQRSIPVFLKFMLLFEESKNQEEILKAFHALPSFMRADIQHLFWLEKGGRENPHFGFFGYGEEEIKRNPECLIERPPSLLEKYIAIQQEKERENIQPLISLPEDPTEILGAFEALPSAVQTEWKHLLWQEDGGRTDLTFGSPNYAEEKIKRDPTILIKKGESVLEKYHALLQEKLSLSMEERLNQYEKETALPDQPIDCKIENQIHPLTSLKGARRTVMVTAEFNGVLGMGGLGPAVKDMAQAYSAKTRVIMPKYDVIDPKIKMEEKPKYNVTLNQVTYKVYKAKIPAKHGYSRVYFIEDPLFEIGRDGHGKPHSIYEADLAKYRDPDINTDAVKNRRWAHFGSHAAKLCELLSEKKKNPVEVAHCHDSQAALAAYLLKKKDKRPAIVFTYHNNNSPLHYHYPEVQNHLSEIGLPYDPLIALVKGLECSDMSTTVSETFAKESQTPLFGRELEMHVKTKAQKRELVGIVNGNTDSWDPRTNRWLAEWKTTDGRSLDLTYSHNDPHLPETIKLIRQQLAEYMKLHMNYEIDVKKPILFYVGRYDPSQKGVDKFPEIAREASERGMQCIFIGTDAECSQQAEGYLQEVERYGQHHPGIFVIRDYKRQDGFYYWQQGNTFSDDKSGVPGFGPLLRAAADLAIFPSIFEPCGLVQGESHRFGVPTIAPELGGFKDTILTSGINKNGYLFKRHDDWYSNEQNASIARTLRDASEDAKTMLAALYGDNSREKEESVAQKRVIMRNAAASTWITTPDGSLSAREKYSIVYEQAIKNKTKPIPMDLYGFSRTRILWS